MAIPQHSQYWVPLLNASSRRRSGDRTFILLLSTLLFLPLPSCNILGPAYVMVHGPEKTPAQYKLAKDRPTVVFVDDLANVLPRRTFRTQIAKTVQEALLKEGVLTNVIDSASAMQVAVREPAGEPMDVTTLGRAVQAEVVIYITIDSFALSPDGQSFSPASKVHVKVMDVPAAQRLWPDKDKKDGQPMDSLLRNTQGTIPRSGTEQLNALSALADRTGLLIAQMFYDHETIESINQKK